MTPVQELGEKLHAKRVALKSVFDEAGENYDMSKVTSIPGDEKAKLEKIQEMNRELAAVNDEYQKAADIDRIARENASGLTAMDQKVNGLQTPNTASNGAVYTPSGLLVPRKSLGQMFVDSAEYKAVDNWRVKGVRCDVEVESHEMKTLLDTTGLVPQPPLPSFFVPSPRRRLVVTDLMPNVNISYPIITWFEQTTNTINAGVTAQSAAKNESAIAWTLRRAGVSKITDSMPTTEEVMEDMPQARSMIDDTLLYNIRYAEEDESLNGPGTGEHLLGLTQLPNILTLARTAGTDSNGDVDNNVDAIFKMFTMIRYTGANTQYAEPSAVVVHPTNWQTIRLMKTMTGEYIWGPPSESGDERTWGKPVVITPAMTVNQALTGDFMGYAKFYRYKAVGIQAGWINDQFIKNQMTILAEERVGQAVTRQTAFGLITSLN